MRAFSDRLVDRLGILSGRTTALVGFTASIANSLLVPPPGRMGDKITLLREIIAQSPDLDGIFAGYPDGAFIQAAGLANGPQRNYSAARLIRRAKVAVAP